LTLKSNHETDSAEATEALGRDLATELKGKNLLLRGDLGAGKTTFLRGLAAGLGVQNKVKSPTFVYEKVYKTSEGEIFAHFDLYRLDFVDAEMAARLQELFQNPAATVAVEWGERLHAEILPEQRIELNFTESKNGAREISLNFLDPRVSGDDGLSS
jgi:tRNA threonylcarbamoyladenosine biosynthesis protein TsaE